MASTQCENEMQHSGCACCGQGLCCASACRELDSCFYERVKLMVSWAFCPHCNTTVHGVLTSLMLAIQISVIATNIRDAIRKDKGVRMDFVNTSLIMRQIYSYDTDPISWYTARLDT